MLLLRGFHDELRHEKIFPSGMFSLTKAIASVLAEKSGNKQRVKI